MKTCGLIAALPWICQAFAQATLDSGLMETCKDLGFAGLVWFLVGVMVPRLMATHREERADHATAMKERDELHAKERAELVADMKIDRAENRQLLQRIAEEHAASAQSGHDAAQALKDEIRAVREAVGK